jgi:glycosyltransferase involved in cell wall biosynthesis
MKVYVCSPYPIEGPSARYRIYQFENLMRDRGIEFEIHPLMTSDIFWRKSNQLQLRWFDYFTLFFRFIGRLIGVFLRKYDTILIHREFSPFARGFFHSILPILISKPLIYDYDDAVFVQFPISGLLQKSQIVLAGNAFLVDYARQFTESRNIYYLPTVVDLSQYTKIPKQTDKSIVVGWIGTHSTFEAYLLPVLDIISSICVKNNAEFHVICSLSVQKTIGDLPVVFREWSLENEIKFLNEFDIGIMPLEDNEFTRGKCAFKLIEYGAMGIPSIGSNIGANSTVIEHGTNGFLVNTETEWTLFLEQLIKDSVLRDKMGKAAFLRVKNEFSLDSKVDFLANLLKSVSKSRGVL